MRDIYNNPIKPGDKVRVMEGYGANAGMSRLYKDTIHTVASVHSQCKSVTGYEYGVKLESDPGMWNADRFLVVPNTSVVVGTYFIAQIIESSNGETFSRKGDLFRMKFDSYAEAEKKALALSQKTGTRYAITQLHARVQNLPVYKATVERL